MASLKEDDPIQKRIELYLSYKIPLQNLETRKLALEQAIEALARCGIPSGGAFFSSVDGNIADKILPIAEKFYTFLSPPPPPTKET